MSEPVQRSFSGGEISPQLFGRVDHQKYTAGLRTLRNMPVMRHGGAVSRPGSQFVAEVRDSSKAVRLIPFIFNSSAGQTFIIEFGDLFVRFYQNGGQVVETAVVITAATQANPCQITAAAHGYVNGDEVIIAGVVGMTQLNGRNFLVANATPNTFTLQDKAGVAINSTAFTAYSSGGTVQRVYTLASPYAVADLPNLRYAQTNDVITIVHPSYAPRQLRRLAATNWTFSTITLFSSDGNNYPTGFAMAGTAGAPNPWNTYVVTGVNALGEETSLNGFVAAPATSGAIALATAGTPVTLSWTAPVNGAVYYKVYVCTQRAVGAPPYAQGPLGFIGQTTDIRFVDTGFTPDYKNVPPAFFSKPFTGANDWPSAIGFIQQRLALANSVNKPTTVWLSTPGDFTNFDYHTLSVQDSDGINFIPASEQVNAIQHIIQMRSMILMTDASEINVQGDAAGVIKPTALNPLAQSYYGAGALRPIVLGEVCIFQQAQGWFIRDMAFDFSVDAYRGNDLTVFSPHLFQGFTLVDWCFQQIPHSIIWAVRSDGTLLGLTYVREQQIFAWHRHDFSGGTVENIACIPESPEHGVYMVVKRTIAGVTKRYIERLAPFYWSDIKNAPYLDSWLSYDGANTGSTTMTLTAPASSGWTYTEDLTLTASGAFFIAAMINDQIFLTDSAGNQTRCQIKAFISSTQVTVNPNRTVPTILQNVAVTNWARAIQTVSNLWTLEGQTVSVFADRFVVASPNNVRYPRYTVASGQIVLDKPYSKIYVGLPMTSDLETLDMDTALGDTLIDRAKNPSRLALYLANTRGGFYGQTNPDSDPVNTTADPTFGMFELKAQAERTTYDASPSLTTDPVYVNIRGSWNRNGRVFIRQVDPLPLQILALSPEGMVPVNSPYLRV